MKHAENCPPPFYLCTDCAEDLHNKKPSYQFHIVLQPLLLATWKCEYKVNKIKFIIILNFKYYRYIEITQRNVNLKIL